MFEIYSLIGDTFRAKSYENAVDVIERLYLYESSDIDLPTDLSFLTKIKGIGKGIAEKIIEIQKTGELQKLKELQADEKISTQMLFASVDGVGPVAAKALMQKGYRSIQDLKNALDLSEYKFTNQQKLGLSHYDDLHTRIHRDEIVSFDKIIQKYANNDKQIVITGSYRRGAKTSGDIDILLTDKNNFLNDFVQFLKDHFTFVGTLSSGKHKFSGLFILDKRVRHIDILFVEKEKFYTALLYFTGSKIFNIKMRSRALAKGLSLNEWALSDKTGKQSFTITSEKDIFDILDMDYVEPSKR